MVHNRSSVDELLANWEEVYKKGLLTFWMLLLLYERPTYPYEMSAAIEEISQGTISADGNSMYRALKRFETFDIVRSEFKASDVGPQRRYYSLTDTGVLLLVNFIRRNILVFEEPVVLERIQSVLNSPPPHKEF